jgi:hypothetical protein
VWIYKPPGSSTAIRYAVRNVADGSAAAIWKTSGSGWAPVYLGRELSFTSGGSYVIAEGDTITGAISGATAVVTRVVLETGTFAGSNAAGRLIFAAQVGNFVAESLNVGSNADVATIAADATAITLLPNGRFETVLSNFFGSTDTRRVYGCDGKNRGFEFDGSVFVPINTGMAVDTPVHCFIHKKQLFFSFLASTQNSGVGLPYQWTATTGADEIGIGDDVTGYTDQTGDVLLIFARNSANQLTGSSTADFSLSLLSPAEGAIPYTVQTMGDTFVFDDPGVRQITRTTDYGSFRHEPASELVQPVIDALRGKVIATALYKPRGQYRVYGNDGSGIIVAIQAHLTPYGTIVQRVIGITTLQYPVNVTCACSGEDETGKDVVFFGDDQGYVYQGDKGSSFDGAEIEAYLIMPFNNLKTPRMRKRYRKLVQEMTAVGYSAIRFQPIFSYGDPDVAEHLVTSNDVQGAGGYWDVSNWNEFYWDARIISTPEFDVNGTGINIGLIYYSKSAIDLGHVLQGALLHYSPRRLAR